MIDFVEICFGWLFYYVEYIQCWGKNGYEVEYIWVNYFECYEDEFNYLIDFFDYCNCFGDLLFLFKSFNVSYGDKFYIDK